MTDDEDVIKKRVDDAQDSIDTKKAKARARFFGMTDRLENDPPSNRDALREKLNRIRQYVRETEET
jgi:hypothetical protein